MADASLRFRSSRILSAYGKQFLGVATDTNHDVDRVVCFSKNSLSEAKVLYQSPQRGAIWKLSANVSGTRFALLERSAHSFASGLILGETLRCSGSVERVAEGVFLDAAWIPGSSCLLLAQLVASFGQPELLLRRICARSGRVLPVGRPHKGIRWAEIHPFSSTEAVILTRSDETSQPRAAYLQLKLGSIIHCTSKTKIGPFSVRFLSSSPDSRPILLVESGNDLPSAHEFHHALPSPFPIERSRRRLRLTACVRGREHLLIVFASAKGDVVLLRKGTRYRKLRLMPGPYKVIETYSRLVGRYFLVRVSAFNIEPEYVLIDDRTGELTCPPRPIHRDLKTKVIRFPYRKSHSGIAYLLYRRSLPCRNALVLCYGGYGNDFSHECPFEYLPFIAEGGCVIVPHLPGDFRFAFSEGTDTGALARDQAIWLKAMVKSLRQLGVTSVAIDGSSFGGVTATRSSLNLIGEFKCVIAEAAPFDGNVYLERFKLRKRIPPHLLLSGVADPVVSEKQQLTYGEELARRGACVALVQSVCFGHDRSFSTSAQKLNAFVRSSFVSLSWMGSSMDEENSLRSWLERVQEKAVELGLPSCRVVLFNQTDHST